MANNYVPSCFVQQDDSWIRNESTGDCDSLLLTTRQLSSFVAYMGVISELQRRNEIMSIGATSGFFDVFIGSIGFSDPDIFSDSVGTVITP